MVSEMCDVRCEIFLAGRVVRLCTSAALDPRRVGRARVPSRARCRGWEGEGRAPALWDPRPRGDPPLGPLPLPLVATRAVPCPVRRALRHRPYLSAAPTPPPTLRPHLPQGDRRRGAWTCARHLNNLTISCTVQPRPHPSSGGTRPCSFPRSFAGVGGRGSSAALWEPRPRGDPPLGPLPLPVVATRAVPCPVRRALRHRPYLSAAPTPPPTLRPHLPQGDRRRGAWPCARHQYNLTISCSVQLRPRPLPTCASSPLSAPPAPGGPHPRSACTPAEWVGAQGEAPSPASYQAVPYTPHPWPPICDNPQLNPRPLSAPAVNSPNRQSKIPRPQ